MLQKDLCLHCQIMLLQVVYLFSFLDLEFLSFKNDFKDMHFCIIYFILFIDIIFVHLL